MPQVPGQSGWIARQGSDPLRLPADGPRLRAFGGFWLGNQARSPGSPGHGCPAHGACLRAAALRGELADNLLVLEQCLFRGHGFRLVSFRLQGACARFVLCFGASALWAAALCFGPSSAASRNQTSWIGTAGRGFNARRRILFRGPPRSLCPSLPRPPRKRAATGI